MATIQAGNGQVPHLGGGRGKGRDWPPGEGSDCGSREASFPSTHHARLLASTLASSLPGQAF